ncbi:hypothetical protein PPYR_03706 [Photinus pyralis]|uniref:Uncharacterized protein n=2 Tax=Photinus pyralis TaxID=7054 RepID=A0A5N4A3L6_PHOPY|nr:uncharacterized protein LOC116161294 [Photinus pyralis]KAB0791906.1 hypothetical protein PPYR_03706 [Photinus pyralis]
MWPELISSTMATTRSANVLAVYAFTLILGLSAQIHKMDDVDNRLETASDSPKNVIDFVLFSNLLRNYSFYDPRPMETSWGINVAVDYGYDDFSASSSSQEGPPEEDYRYETPTKLNKKKAYGNRDRRSVGRLLSLRNKYDDPKVTAEYYDKKGGQDE